MEPQESTGWDATCHDSFAASNLTLGSMRADAVVDKAAAAESRLCSELCTSYHFVPVALESTGAFGQDATAFFKELGNRTRTHTGDPLSYLKHCQV